jgi:parallel beta-helix repeat protein
MIKRIWLALSAFFILVNAVGQERSLVPGMKITRSTKIKKAVYSLAAALKNDKGTIVVEGSDIIIDFNNAELNGSTVTQRPDEFSGTGLLIVNSNNVTIRNLKARGFKLALVAFNATRLTLENCDLSYNYRPQLNSTSAKEDISDWMSYHHNDKDEWTRYGAAIYMRGCNQAMIRNCKVTGGQNALMMTSCNECMIYNNDFSFNSGIGIGMYRCSNNSVLYNRAIFNVRGYSHGVYSRGQDSAGFLVYEQSDSNLFYKNNVTHSGDGFFLWAGQTTMDSGKGGCNDNRIIGNDFSYAPTNGIEVTFSRNFIARNRLFECDNGIWGGYSFESIITNNQFRNNKVGIAIEHGQENKIAYNIFSRDKEAIRLWADTGATGDWGYPKYRDTRSHDYRILSNSFNSNPVVFGISNTENLRIFNNTISDAGKIYKTAAAMAGLDTLIHDGMEDEMVMDSIGPIPAIANPNDPFKGAGVYAGRKNIMITEWGPYDFRSPVVWNTNPTDSNGTLDFDIKGPKGTWSIRKVAGLKDLSLKSGTVPGTLTARRDSGAGTDISLELEYKGLAITTPFGAAVPAGKPYVFSFSRFFQPVAWTISWFAMDTSVYNPLKTGDLFAPNVRMAPVKTEHADRLSYAWWGGLKADRNYGQFITMASGEGTFQAGRYELSITWDDALRVYVDNKLVLDEWVPSNYDFETSPHRNIPLELGGTHQFRIEHLGLGDFAVLSLQLRKATSGQGPEK